jgi:hypothetical protein
MTELILFFRVLDEKNSVFSGGALIGTFSSLTLARLLAVDNAGLLGRGSRLRRSRRLGDFFASLGRDDCIGLPSFGEQSGVDEIGIWLDERSREDAKGSWGREGWLGI